MTEFFTDVTAPIPFAGSASTGDLAYRVYDPNRIVAGKRCAEFNQPKRHSDTGIATDCPPIGRWYADAPQRWRCYSGAGKCDAVHG